MKLGPRYKIARRLGSHVFDKTQGPKFAASQARKTKGSFRPKAKSEFAIQMLEKQKARFTYGITERQFSKYVKNAIEQKKTKTDERLYETLESRLDNVVYRMGLANSRRLARQIVSHGHMTVNGVKVTVPSYLVSVDDVVAIRAASQVKPLFVKASEKLKEATIPAWIKADIEKKEATIVANPKFSATETMFDISAILEFYRR